MGTVIRYGFLLLSGVLCLGTSPSEAQTQAVDWADGAERLARAKFDIPESTDAMAAAGRRFACAARPAIRGRRGRTSSRSIPSRRPARCSGAAGMPAWWHPVSGNVWPISPPRKGRANVSVARLCIVQAESLQWTLPMRGTADQTLYAAVGAQSLLGQVLRDSLPPGSSSREAATQWLRTAAGQLATYGSKGDASFRNMAQGLVDRSGILTEQHDAQASDEAFFAQLDLTRPDMSEVARSRGSW